MQSFASMLKIIAIDYVSEFQTSIATIPWYEYLQKGEKPIGLRRGNS